MKTRPPHDYWEWKRALASSGLKSGVKATALAWETYCWDWAQGREEDEVLAFVRPPSLEAFAEHHRDGVNERTVRRHLRDLKDAGLLVRRRGHSRWGPDVYVPRVPVAAANTGHESPVSIVNTGHGGPLLEANTGHQRPVSEVNTGHLASQHRTSGDLSPYSPEVPQTPLLPPPDGGGREEGTTTEGGGRTADDERTWRIAAALDAIRGLMPAEIAQKLDGTTWRHDCAPWVGTRLDGGWTPRALAERVNRDPWTGVRSPLGVLRSRLVDLPDLQASTSLSEGEGLDAGQESSSLAAIAQRRAAEAEQRRTAAPAPAGLRDVLRRPRSGGDAQASAPSDEADDRDRQEVGA